MLLNVQMCGWDRERGLYRCAGGMDGERITECTDVWVGYREVNTERGIYGRVSEIEQNIRTCGWDTERENNRMYRCVGGIERGQQREREECTDV